MSEYKETKLSEADKLLKKVAFIYKELSGDQEVDITKGVKDKYELKKYQIHTKLKDIETEIHKREQITGDNPKDIMTRVKYSEKIEEGLREVGDNLKELEIILKKEGKNETKEKSKTLLQQTYELLVARSSGQYVDQEELNNKMDNLKKLDEILLDRQREPPSDKRELYQEEKDKMNEWNDKVGNQDKRFEHIGLGVKELAVKSRKIGEQTDEMGRVINDVQNDASKTEKVLETTNAKLKKLLNNLRSGDKICIDIILILICLGLIAVLYNLISSKFSSKATTTTTSTSTTGLRFLTII